jgi:hypothetical protein
MYRALGPLRTLLRGVPWPAEQIPLPQLADDLLDRVFVLDTSLEVLTSGYVVWASVAWEGELSFGFPGSDAVTLVVGGDVPADLEDDPPVPVVVTVEEEEELGGEAPVDYEDDVVAPVPGYTSAVASLELGQRGALTVHDIVLSLRFAPWLLKPVALSPDDEVPEHAGVSVRGSVAIDESLNVRVDGFASTTLTPSMIGDTGVIVAAEDVEFSLLQANPEVRIHGARVLLPDDLVAGSLLPLLPQLVLEDATFNLQGFSGSLAVTWPLEFDDDSRAYVYRVPVRADDGTFETDAGGDVVEELRDATLLGLPGGVRHIALRFEQNQLTGCDIAGALLVPFFDEPVDIRIIIEPSGDFSVTLLGGDEDGLTLTKDELLALTIRSLRVAKEGDVGELVVSGGLEPLVMASDGLQWPRLDVTDLMIDTEGHFRIREAWLDLKDLATLDLFGFPFELARVGLGYEEPRTDALPGRLWVDLAGSLRLIEQIPVGLGVEGFRLSWPENLDELVGLDGPVMIDQALAILGQLEVKFDGINLFFGIPDSVEFEGLIRFVKEAQIVGFAGDVALRVPASGFALEAGLLVGMNFEPPPFPFLYVQFGVELPVGIPLGQSGLALKGAKGLFGLNVSPAKAPEANWFYDWYKRPPEGAHPTRKWENQRGALAFGAGLTVTTADGYVKGVRGLLVLSLPGPVLIIEGRALILDFLGGGDPPFGALAVFDGNQRTVQFNIEAQAELVENLLEAHGGLEAFFDFEDLTNWHLYLGQDEPEDRRVQANVLKLPDSDRFLFDADGYLMLDMVGSTTVRSRLGLSVSFGERFDEFEPFVVELDASVTGNGTVTVLPEQFSGDVDMAARLEVSAFDVGVQLAANAAVATEGPEPFRVEANLDVTAELPAPLPPFEMEYTFRWEAPPSSELVPPLVGVAVDADLSPGGGGLELFGPADRLPEVDTDPNRPDARTAAAASPTVSLDGRPTLLFGHDMNDETSGVFARDSDGETRSHRLGRLELTPVLHEVTLYEHRKSNPWTDDFAADWQLVASSTPTSGLDPLWGVWLADAGLEDPIVRGARRLRLWTANPFVHARGLVGPGYLSIFGLPGARTSYAEEFLRDYPDYFECRGLEAEETCVDFADAPKLPKEGPPRPDGRPGPPVWTHGAITFTGVASLVGGGSGPCLDVQATIHLRFPAPVARARLHFCGEPGLSPAAARERVAPRRTPPGKAEAPCSEPVEFEVAVVGTVWTIEGDEAFDCLEITRPAPIASICFVPASETARAERAAGQCALNAELVERLGETPLVLRPGSFYRLMVRTAVDAALIPAPDDSPIASILDGLYTAALDMLEGEQEPRAFFHEAFFQTEGPPRSLAPYVKWSSPEAQAARVFRDDDLIVRFRRSYVEELYSKGLELVVRDAQGRAMPGYETAWSQADTATLLPDERTWRAQLNDPPLAPRDNLVAARRKLTLADNFDDAGLTAWQATSSQPLRRVRWRVADGELRGAGGAHAGSSLRADFAKPGPMLVSTRPAPSSFVLEVDLGSDTGEAIGVVFCLADGKTFYRFSMDDRASYRRLVKVRAGIASLMHETAEGFERGPLHGLEVVVAPVCDAVSISVRLDGRLWATVLDELGPLHGTGVGLYCWRTDAARFARVRVRDGAEPALAPGLRYELVVHHPADDLFVPYRVPFVTSAFARFRDLALSFAGDAVPLECAPLDRPHVDAVVSATETYVAGRTSNTEGRALFREQELDRAGVEARKLEIRESRAMLDEAFRALADQAGIPWLNPTPEALTLMTLTLAEGPVAGFWLRSPEPLQLRYGNDDAHVGRTVIELAHRPAEGGERTPLPTVQLANADGTEVLLVPPGVANGGTPNAWSMGAYRLNFTYHRDRGANSEDDRSDLPVEQRLGSDAPEHVSLDWTV